MMQKAFVGGEDTLTFLPAGLGHKILNGATHRDFLARLAVTGLLESSEPQHKCPCFSFDLTH